jgi:RNA 2',3'-cyclic 3'-phosphodiesterase
MSHRLFFAIRPPAPVRDAIIDIEAGIDNARWQDEDQLHLTLRYIGDVETHLADDLADAAALLRFDPFELRVAGCGHFEKKGRPTSVWAGIAPSEPLVRLQRKLEQICVKCGLPAETRKFAPHITVARLNSSSESPASFLARHAGLDLGPWTVDSYILYQSHLRDQGSLYEPILTYQAANQ